MNKTDVFLIFVFGFSIALITIGLIDLYAVDLLTPVTCKAAEYCISGVHLFK